MDCVQIQALLVKDLRLWLDQLHHDLHVVELVVLAAHIDIVDGPLDAQGLQDVAEVLLKSLFAVLVGQ